MTTEMQSYYIRRIGQNKGAPRVWLEGQQALRAGFKPGQRYDVKVQGQTVVLQANKDGSRVVSAKKKGDMTNPVIDLNSKELLAMFDGMASVRVVAREGQIYILPLASEIKVLERRKRLKEKLENGEPLKGGSVSHGVGILSHAIHTGLKNAGIKMEMAFANEIRPELLEHAAIHNDAWADDTQMLAAPMQELAFDDRGLAHIPKVDVLELGLPCSGASVAGMAKRGLGHPEQHPEVGHLVVAALIILNKAAPAICLFENVPNYANSASASILRNQLRDMGYETHERILNGKEWGALENRNRWCMVAVTRGIHFDFDQLMPGPPRYEKLGEALDQVPDDSPRWKSFDGLVRKEASDIAAGKGFRLQRFNPDDDHIATITKGYAKVRSTDPRINHPTDPNLMRQLSAQEHSRIKEIPPHLIGDLSETIAHEALGQSVVYMPFHDVGKHLGEALGRFRDGVPAPAASAKQVAAATDADVPLEVMELAAEVELTALRRADEKRGQYIGAILAITPHYVIQDEGRGQGVVHRTENLTAPAKLGEVADVHYQKGRGTVKARDQPKMQMALKL